MDNPVKTWREHKKLSRFLGKKGKIVTWTYLKNLAFGVVELTDGKRMTIQISDPKKETIKIGRKVKLVIRRSGKENKDGVIRYILKAKLI